MKHQESFIKADGFAESLYFQAWMPETNSPKAVVCLVHGHGEYSGRYAHVGYFLSRKEYALLAIDLVGHGRSEGKRGHVETFAQYLACVEALRLKADEMYPGVPKILYGHSMGANIAANYLLQEENRHNFKMLVMSSPWLKLAFDPPAWKITLGRLMKRIYPAYTERSNLNPSHLSKNQKVVREYIADAMVHDQISTSAYFGIVDAGLYALENARKLRIPLLVMHGESDQITSNMASSEFAYQANGAYKEWEDGYHELHNDREWKDVLTYSCQWAGRQLDRIKLLA